jgi:hypothetical protein
MALDARQTALLRPAAVAVHDDGNVSGKTRRIKPGVSQAPEGFGT